MNLEMTHETKAPMTPVEPAEMNEVVGGVMPMWDADGRMITCTDPLRWRSPGTLYPTPYRF